MHPNIAPLVGYYLSDDFKESYIVSEWMKNGNVRDYLARERPSINARLQLVGFKSGEANRKSPCRDLTRLS